MTKGGARNRGPGTPQPGSENDLRRRRGALVLPRAGYRGQAPAFPLPASTDREGDVWRLLWRSPQAAAWADESWRWYAIAMYVRWSVRMEAEDASAALGNVVVRFADQIGLTPAGLKENDWVLEERERARPGEVVGLRPGEGSPSLERARARSVRERLKDAEDRPRSRFATTTWQPDGGGDTAS